MIHPTIKATISKVEKGQFDPYLKILEKTNLGIFINAYVKNGQVLPIPDGYHQSESNLYINLATDKAETDIQVGWFGQTHAICSNHPSCDDYKHGPKKPIDDPLQNAVELSINVVYKTVDKYRAVINELFVDGMGLFIVHGHNQKFSFTELPPQWVAVIKNNQTHFRLRGEVMDNDRFVPNIWRMENGVRQVVGGFTVS